EYPVLVGRGLLDSGWWPLESRRFLVSDRSVGPLYGDRVEPLGGRAEIEAGEAAKTLANTEKVLREMARAGATREDQVVAARAVDRIGPAGLDEVVFACARYKCAIVAADELDTGLRNVLNLGHTVGHAIESATGYTAFRHGEAVGLGLLAALRLSNAPALRDE